MTKYKHLTHEQRVLIEDRLNHKISIRSIAKELNKSPSTILREIDNHSTYIKSNKNLCDKRRDCNYKHICGNKDCNNLCYICHANCNKYCIDFEKVTCPVLTSSPYLCNGCNKGAFCEYDKIFYKAINAHKQYKTQLSESRSGFDVSEAELKKIDKLASPMIKNGLSPYHVIQTHKDAIPISEATLRRMIDKNAISAHNIDLRDKVKRKQRKSKDIHPLSTSKVGHFYGDFLKYMDENDTIYAQMDCVEGKRGECATLLTLTHPLLSLQIAIILNNQDSCEVVKALDKLEIILGSRLFNQIYPVILTDNGSEFSNITAMEASIDGIHQLTKIFFCERLRSDEKGSYENHHKQIRYIIPKGTSLEPFTQFDINLMMNHINSYKRKALLGKSALELAKTIFPEDFFILLGIEEIPPEQIILKPKLLNQTETSVAVTLTEPLM